MKNTVAGRKKLSILVSLALGTLGAGTALAQQASDVQRIEVTGSRLPSLSLEGPSPVTVLDAQNIAISGQSKAEDLLGALPSAATGQTSYQSNGSTGTATVSLRGVGATRNLVLVNGRRLPPGSPTQGGYAADLNQIPVPLVQRVEVLTGGASAVYGSDAISGVVNFIMKDNFEGLQVDLGHSFYNHDQHSFMKSIIAAKAATNPSQFVVPGDVDKDGEVNQATVLLGGNFANGRGNATTYFNWKKEDAILQAARDFSACAIGSGATYTCGGSSTSFPGRFLMGNVGNSLTVADAAGNTRPYSSATDAYNFGPLNYWRRPSEKYSFGAFAHYDVFSDLRVYSELGFHQDTTTGQIAPSGSFGVPFAIQSTNPLLTPAWIAAFTADNAAAGLPFDPNNPGSLILLRRNVEGGGRADDIRHTSFRFVFGMKGDAFKYWHYDVSMQTGRVVLNRTYLNDFSITRLNRAMDVVTDANGNAVCRSVVDGTDPNCVPWNIWRLGAVNPAALAYLQTPGLANGYTQQQIISTNWTVDLGNYGVKLPMAQNGVNLSLGSERRKEKENLQTDVEFSTGDLAGQGGATIGRGGQTQVGEYFGEVKIPLIEKRPMADLLSISGSYRHSKYVQPTEKTANTFGVGVEWAPVAAYKLRGSYQKAIRAANLEELFLAQGNNLFDTGGADPCGPGGGATLAQCMRTGITAANYQSPLLNNVAGQYNFLQGGNPNLNPETAHTGTVGLVFQPTRNLSGSIDYWSIKIDDYISNAPPLTILQTCLNTGQMCANVQRDQFGSLWILPAGRVIALNDNLGGLLTRGWDFALSYDHRMGSYGGLNLNVLGTYMTKWTYEPIKGLGKFDCVGFYGSQCGSPTPKWRHTARLTWTTPWNLQLAATWRHVDGTMSELTSNNPILAGAVNNTDRELARRDYLDLAGSYRINKTFSLTGGINNVTDKDPPIVSNTASGPSVFGNGNTFPNTYDVLGRLVFLNLTAKF